MAEKKILEIYANSWNTLNTEKLEKFIDDHVVYNSQWVYDTLNGKIEFMNYFNGKLETLKKSTSQTKVKAELKTIINYMEFIRRPCIEVTQRTKEEEVQVYITIEINKGKITQINMCHIPMHYITFIDCLSL